ncbi:hypothetical protein Ga0080574_TMP3712 [Salipiger abyssi]|uniref:Sel1 repeat family protein n=2 Tax=Salipiger abyssi TaxID=1250539 RepID=A0A1P8UXG9_9RHOB|nr:hypothetical protein Ga0080574_TMP3712 [Salipiger abyssi]
MPEVQAEGEAEAPDMAEIEEAWRRGDYVFVRRGLKRLAEEAGTGQAQYRYGRVLVEGRGGPRDIHGAVDWLTKASEQNVVEAATLLARIYLSGPPDGPERDPVQAARLLSRSAARGDAEAQYYLGLLYRAGTGVDQDPASSYNWFLAAAENGHVAAQYELSRALSRGEGTALDTDEALRWLRRAAEGGHVQAQYFLALALDSGRGAPQDRDAALDWVRRAAEAGFLPAQRVLGEKYLVGDGVEPQPAETLRWLETAADTGDSRSQYLLARAYLGEGGVPPNGGEALQLLKAASDAGYGPATTRLAQLQETGEAGLAPDLEGAVALYRKAEAQGDAAAAVRLGVLAGEGSLDGLAAPHAAVPWAIAAAEQGDAGALDWVRGQAEEGLRPARTAYGIWLLAHEGDPEEAAGLLLKAAEAGDVRAQFRYGELLSTGTGVAQDYAAAHMWMNIAAASGSSQAAQRRDVLSDLMTPEQVADAQRAARVHFDRMAAEPPVTSQ